MYKKSGDIVKKMVQMVPDIVEGEDKKSLQKL